jgi:hypothetical protein
MLALLAANRLGDSSGDAARAALLAMTIRPPMMGLLVALVVAKKKAPKTVTSSGTGSIPLSSGGSAAGGIIDRTIPRIDRSFFPSFIDETRKQAAHLAKELGLNAIFPDAEGASGRAVVARQEPPPGAPWPHDLKDVTLHLE